MGKATGFLEYERKAKSSVDPLVRIKNFDEFHPPLAVNERQEQAARCMNCGVPFCQSGIQLRGMWTGCPLHNLIPEYNDLIYNGSWKYALARLRKTNNFPEFTGRVCPALCEVACTCGLNGDPVTAHDNEYAIVETGYANGWITPEPPKVRSGKKVAIVGSGPSGLAAADCLNKRGHSVTVYERENRPGGLLMYGIPNMKLDKHVISRRTKIMEAEGVEFKTNMNVGAEADAQAEITKGIPAVSLAAGDPEANYSETVTAVAPEELLENYDAVILCCGSKAARDLNVPGRDADGIYFAVDFLKAATKKVTGQTEEFAVTANGKNVVIIGGGDTGNDCVGTSIRQGCISVTQLEMMPKSPDTRAADNPWPQWPLVCKTDYGQEEAIAKFGHDPRIYQTTVKEVIKDDNGAIKELVTIKLESRVDESTGRRYMGEIEGSEETIPCELLLIAAGFVGCEDYVAQAFGCEKAPRGNLATADGHYATNVPKVFTAGDAHRGQSLVVWGITEGRACAKEVDEYLMGYTNM